MKAFLGLAASLLLAAPLLAGEITSETLGAKSFMGNVTANVSGEILSTTPRAGTVVYSNISGTTILATSAAGTGNIWGDRIYPDYTGAGTLLDTASFSVFNSTSGGNVSPISQCDITVFFYNNPGATASTASPIGGFITHLDMVAAFGGAGLPAGYYSTWTISGLGGLNLNMTADMLMVQQLSNVTGGTTRTGIICANPISKGASDGSFYNAAVTTTGYVAFASPNQNNGNPYYELQTTPEPASLALLALGGLLTFRRR